MQFKQCVKFAVSDSNNTQLAKAFRPVEDGSSELRRIGILGDQMAICLWPKIRPEKKAGTCKEITTSARTCKHCPNLATLSQATAVALAEAKHSLDGWAAQPSVLPSFVQRCMPLHGRPYLLQPTAALAGTTRG